MAKTAFPIQGGPGLIPAQGTKSHKLQLRVCSPQLEILNATMKIDLLEQPNKYINSKNKY